MLRRMKLLTILMTLIFLISTPSMMAQNISRQYDDDNYDSEKYGYEERFRVDRYLDVEVWTNHNDGEYYEGDNVVIHYRVNRDAYIVIYSIDTRGRVNLLFPADPTDNNYVEAGITYRMPNNWDDYELVVSGPEGVENIQIIASRERIPIPDWYPVSGLVSDWDNRFEFMDYINDRYFLKYNGQRMAYDRTAIYIEEWEDYYFQPVYHPVYHHWTLCGNVYLDYPWGSTVYVNGIYWGCTPLYLPRVYVGWHTFTVYDPWGYCWESDIHVSRYHTIVLDNEIVRPGPHVQSKYKQVRTSGYRSPVKNGYPNFAAKKVSVMSSKLVTKKNVVIKTGKNGKATTGVVTISPKKNQRGSTAMIKTDRGWETSGIGERATTKGYGKSSRQSVTVSGSSKSDKSRSKGIDYGSSGSYNSGGSKKSGRSSVTINDGSSSKGNKSSKSTIKSQDKSSSSSGYYQKKSGKKNQKSGSYKSSSSKSNKSGKSTKTYKQSTPSKKSGSSKSSGTIKSSKQSSGKSSGSSGSKSSGKKSSSGGSKSKGRGGK